MKKPKNIMQKTGLKVNVKTVNPKGYKSVDQISISKKASVIKDTMNK